MRRFTYIAADFDHDQNAVDHLHWMKDHGLISFLDAHELHQSSDSSLPCSIKKSLKQRMDSSYKFILVVGSQTDAVTKGGCQLCGSYNSYTRSCARGHSIDYRSYVKYECDIAVESDLQVVVLYNDTFVDRSVCPAAVRHRGTHRKMQYRDASGTLRWDDASIIQAIRG